MLCDLKEKHHPIDRLKQRFGIKSHMTEIPLYNMKMLCGGCCDCSTGFSTEKLSICNKVFL